MLVEARKMACNIGQYEIVHLRHLLYKYNNDNLSLTILKEREIKQFYRIVDCKV